MKHCNSYIKLSLLFFCFYLYSFTQENKFKQTKLEISETFFPNNTSINKHNIDWYSFEVPENWEKETENKVKLAVAYLHSYKKTDKSLVFLSGGPGGWSIGALRKWLKHPIREDVNIVLMDLRGTGFSDPLLCPDYGNELLDIFSENNSLKEEMNAIENLSLKCLESINERNIDVKSFNSEYVSHDIHALKNQLKIRKWFIYGVSYGTYIAQRYMANYPSDVSKVILDSPIAESEGYYVKNTQNFFNSLQVVFKESKNDYPNLEDDYNKVIRELNINPITVKVKENIIRSGAFTFNKENFKLIIQQCLYKKESIEAIPSIIGAFNDRDQDVLSKLVDAFSSKLKRDYGTYYCMTCNDMFTEDLIDKFDKVPEGLSYYKSDLKVCEKWNLSKLDSLNTKDNLSFDKPVLILAGKYDPITPLVNGKKLESEFSNATFLEMPYGHGTGFLKEGKTIVSNFLKRGSIDKRDDYDFASVSFFKNVYKNKGIGNLITEIIRPNFLFLAPLIIAIFILIITIISYSVNLFKKNTKENTLKNILLCLSLFICVALGSIIFAINESAQQNFYLLLFGVPKKFEFIFWLKYPLFLFFIISFTVFIFRFKHIKTREIYSSVLFSVVLIFTYFIYWGVF